MSFLARLSARSLPALSRMPALMPKGLAARQMAPLYREAAPPEEEPEIAPWRVAPSRPLQRAEARPGENEELARASDEEPEEDKPDVQPARLRRGAREEEQDEAVAPLRRSAALEEPEEEPAAQPMRTIRRAEEVPLDDGEKPLRQPFQADLVPGAMPAHPDLANEEEPSDLQALRRDVVPPRHASAAPLPAPAPAPCATDAWLPRPMADWTAAEPDFAPKEAPFETDSFTPAPASARPQVIIDQLDVLIHEPVAAEPARALADHGRLMRARYLRRL